MHDKASVLTSRIESMKQGYTWVNNPLQVFERGGFQAVFNYAIAS